MRFVPILPKLLALALAASAPAANAATLEIEVNGLVCAFCAQGIDKSLSALPGVAGVFVSLEHRLVAVALQEGDEPGDDAVRRAITDAGYTTVAIQRTDATLDAIRARIADAADDAD